MMLKGRKCIWGVWHHSQQREGEKSKNPQLKNSFILEVRVLSCWMGGHCICKMWHHSSESEVRSPNWEICPKMLKGRKLHLVGVTSPAERSPNWTAPTLAEFLSSFGPLSDDATSNKKRLVGFSAMIGPSIPHLTRHHTIIPHTMIGPSIPHLIRHRTTLPWYTKVWLAHPYQKHTLPATLRVLN